MNDDFSFDFLFCVNHLRALLINSNFAPIYILIPNIIARSIYLVIKRQGLNNEGITLIYVFAVIKISHTWSFMQ